MLDSINYRRISRLLKGFYHRKDTGRKPYNPLSMLKAQLLKHLFRIPSDLRLALRLKYDWQAARACRFRKRNPSHGLFTQFRHRLGEETHLKIFNHLLRQLLESGVIIGRVIAVDSTHVKAYSQRSRDNKIGSSDPDARWGVASGASSSDTGCKQPAAPAPRCPSPSPSPHATKTTRPISSLSFRLGASPPLPNPCSPYYDLKLSSLASDISRRCCIAYPPRTLGWGISYHTSRKHRSEATGHNSKVKLDK